MKHWLWLNHHWYCLYTNLIFNHLKLLLKFISINYLYFAHKLLCWVHYFISFCFHYFCLLLFSLSYYLHIGHFIGCLNSPWRNFLLPLLGYGMVFNVFRVDQNANLRSVFPLVAHLPVLKFKEPWLIYPSQILEFIIFNWRSIFLDIKNLSPLIWLMDD